MNRRIVGLLALTTLITTATTADACLLFGRCFQRSTEIPKKYREEVKGYFTAIANTSEYEGSQAYPVQPKLKPFPVIAKATVSGLELNDIFFVSVEYQSQEERIVVPVHSAKSSRGIYNLTFGCAKLKPSTKYKAFSSTPTAMSLDYLLRTFSTPRSSQPPRFPSDSPEI